MQVLFVHQNFPGPFANAARALVHGRKWQCAFISTAPPVKHDGIENIQYALRGGATRHTHFCSRTFENAVWHCDAIYSALKDRPDLEPDLIVGHSGIGSTLFLRELYPRAAVVNLFEFFYRPHHAESDIDFRKDLGWPISSRIHHRACCRNATQLLDLHNCRVGYTPTIFQRNTYPIEFQPRLRAVFDGIDRTIFHGSDGKHRPPASDRPEREIAGVKIGAGKRIVTYVSRAFESLRGFDIFMRAASTIAEQNPDVEFIIIGGEDNPFGGDLEYIAPHPTFKEWALARGSYDPARFHFVGILPPRELAEVLAATDLHIYLTVPFPISRSMMDAMSCGAVVLGSDTGPVREMIQPGKNGLLADIFKPEEIAAKALDVLKNPDEFRPLGLAAEALIRERYSIEATTPRLLSIYDEAMNGSSSGTAPAPISEEMAEELFSLNRPKTHSPFRG